MLRFWLPTDGNQSPYLTRPWHFIRGFPGASLVTQMVKNLPTIQETQIWCLGWEDPLEKGMATHSSILAWRIPWIEESCGPQSTGLLRVRHDLENEQQPLHNCKIKVSLVMQCYLLFITLEKETATHSSICLENPVDRGRSLAGCSPWARKRVGHNLMTKQQAVRCCLLYI